MAKLDAATLAQQLLKLKLVTDEQLQECRDEEGRLGPTKEALLRALERKGYLTNWQSQKLLKGEPDGYYIGKYRLLYLISAGTFGRVYRAEDPRTGMVVAVKVLRRRWYSDPHNIEQFEREAKVGLAMRHPNIVSILSMNRDVPTKQYYMVLEFVEGGSLRDFLAIRKKLEPAEALRLLEDAAAGLAYAFSRGVTHRDMKLTNILISSSGTAKLVDFGLAGVNAAQEDDDQVDRSIDYAALERATGVKPGDDRSDIYFMGCVFYEMLTGRPPLTMSRDRQERMQRQRFEKVPPINHEEIQAAPVVFQLLDTMMSLLPQRRFQTPAQMLEAVRSARREVDQQRFRAASASASSQAAAEEATVFVVETNQRLQEVLREKIKEQGYRVLLSVDPENALTRFRQKPYDALIMDAGSTGEEGIELFDRILIEAELKKLSCVGILILSEDQAELAQTVGAHPSAAILVRPVTMRQLSEKLAELVPPRPADVPAEE